MMSYRLRYTDYVIQIRHFIISSSWQESNGRTTKLLFFIRQNNLFLWCKQLVFIQWRFQYFQKLYSYWLIWYQPIKTWYLTNQNRVFISLQKSLNISNGHEMTKLLTSDLPLYTNESFNMSQHFYIFNFCGLEDHGEVILLFCQHSRSAQMC